MVVGAEEDEVGFTAGIAQGDLLRVREIARSLETRRAQIAAKGKRLENGRRLVRDTSMSLPLRRRLCVWKAMIGASTRLSCDVGASEAGN